MKWCADVESRLAAAKEHALSQTATIDELFRTIDDISAEVLAYLVKVGRLPVNWRTTFQGEMRAALGGT